MQFCAATGSLAELPGFAIAVHLAAFNPLVLGSSPSGGTRWRVLPRLMIPHRASLVYEPGPQESPRPSAPQRASADPAIPSQTLRDWRPHFVDCARMNSTPNSALIPTFAALRFATGVGAWLAPDKTARLL